MSFFSEDPSQLRVWLPVRFVCATFTLFPQAPKRSDATVQFVDTGHFALEAHLEEIALAMRAFLGRLPPDEPRLKEVPAVIEEAASLLRGKTSNERRA
jgi:hypothetical protein